MLLGRIMVLGVYIIFLFCSCYWLFMCIWWVMYILFMCVLMLDSIWLVLAGVCSVSVCSVEIGISGWFSVRVIFCVIVIVRCMLVKVLGLWLSVIVFSCDWVMFVLVSSVLVYGRFSLVWWCGVILKCFSICLFICRVME